MATQYGNDRATLILALRALGKYELRFVQLVAERAENPDKPDKFGWEVGQELLGKILGCSRKTANEVVGRVVAEGLVEKRPLGRHGRFVYRIAQGPNVPRPTLQVVEPEVGPEGYTSEALQPAKSAGFGAGWWWRFVTHRRHLFGAAR